MSSSSAMSAPAHPEPAEDQPAAVDHRHPRLEPVTDEEIADQRQHGDDEPDDDIGVSKPQSGHGVEQHEVDRPERSDLSRRETAEPAAEYSECDEQQECNKHPHIEGA